MKQIVAKVMYRIQVSHYVDYMRGHFVVGYTCMYLNEKNATITKVPIDVFNQLPYVQ